VGEGARQVEADTFIKEMDAEKAAAGTKSN
jgi:hypothetical protein